ncbi:MAG: hypothetical protein ACE5F9_04915 [Phycisphaerae bacterium]
MAGAVGRWNPRACGDRRCGLVLVVVLVMIALLALLAAAYSFMVRAHVQTVMSNYYVFQARQAADSGLQRALVLLQQSRGDPESWFDNPDEFQHLLVYGTEGSDNVEERSDAERFDPTANAAWRVNLVHPDYDNRDKILYGLTDEGSRLNLNTATEAQIRRLFEAAIPNDADHEVDIDVLVDSLFDWREPGNRARPHGAKDEYYFSLRPPYRAKKGSFATVDELLLVRGFTGWVLFGEDYNRNGLLDPNEDDGDTSFPPDDADGELFVGVAPFLTVWSAEANVSNDNRPRINLNMEDTQKLQELLQDDFSSEIVSYVMQVRSSGMQFNSVMNLIPAPPKPETEEEEPPEEDPGATTQPATSQPDSEADNRKPEGNENDNSDSGQAPPTDNGSADEPPVPAPPPLPEYRDLTEEPPPGMADDLPLILDRLTVAPLPLLPGRINVTTAPREVLSAIEALTLEDVDAIIAARKNLDGAATATPAWLVTEGTIDLYTFRRIVDGITTSSVMYRIEAVGYADHVGVVQRMMTVVDISALVMPQFSQAFLGAGARPPGAQVLYQQDLTPLGVAYNPYGEEKRGLADRSGK